MSQDMKKLVFFIEIPANSSVKYEVDEDTGLLMADRFLHTQMTYPTNYGYIVGTKGKDGDPVDVLVLSSQAVVPGVGIKGHIIGMLEMEDEEGVDTKVLAVPDKKVDPLYGVWESINDVPQHILDRIKHFFDHYKELEPGKFVKTHDFKSRAEAEKEVGESFVEEDCCCGKGGECCGECGDDKGCGECCSDCKDCDCDECKSDTKKEEKKKGKK